MCHYNFQIMKNSILALRLNSNGQLLKVPLEDVALQITDYSMVVRNSIFILSIRTRLHDK